MISTVVRIERHCWSSLFLMCVKVDKQNWIHGQLKVHSFNFNYYSLQKSRKFCISLCRILFSITIVVLRYAVLSGWLMCTLCIVVHERRIFCIIGFPYKKQEHWIVWCQNNSISFVCCRMPLAFHRAILTVLVNFTYDCGKACSVSTGLLKYVLFFKLWTSLRFVLNAALSRVCNF